MHAIQQHVVIRRRFRTEPDLDYSEQLPENQRGIRTLFDTAAEGSPA